MTASAPTPRAAAAGACRTWAPGPARSAARSRWGPGVRVAPACAGASRSPGEPAERRSGPRAGPQRLEGGDLGAAGLGVPLEPGGHVDAAVAAGELGVGRGRLLRSAAGEGQGGV